MKGKYDLWDWEDLPVNKKEIPLDKQQGTNFTPPKKELKEINNNDNKKTSSTNKTSSNGNTRNKNTTSTSGLSNKHNSSSERIIPKPVKTKKVKLTKSEEKQEEFKSFKEELGIDNKKLILAFYNKGIELLSNAIEDLTRLKEDSIKHIED